MQRKLRAFLFSLVIGISAAFSQALQKGDTYFDYFQFKDAAQYYQEALSSGSKKDEAYILHRLGQCYMYLFQYKNAAVYFDKLVKLGDNKPLPDAYVEYGNVLKAMGEYERARDQYRYYLTLIKDDPYAQMLNNSVSWAIANRDSMRNYQVNETDLDISGQSLGYAFFGDGLLYSHARYKKPLGSMPLFDLDYAEIKDSTHFIQGDKIADDIKFDLNEGAPSVNPDGTVIYFTANAAKTKTDGTVKKSGAVQTSADGVSYFKVYSATFLNGTFQATREMPFNNKEYNVTHPTVSDDGNTIFFASDMDGGFGGLDIYRVTKQADGKFGKPENLGASVNTSENEIYPYYNRGLLFFSSKGFRGYGGYDIYVVRMNKAMVSGSVKNIGQPINSFRDDVALITKDGGVTGYFSSNRGNDEGADHVFYFVDRDILKPAVALAKLEQKKEAPKPVASAITQPPPASKVNPALKRPVAPPVAANTEKPKRTVTVREEKPPVPAAMPVAPNLTRTELLKQSFAPVTFNFNESALPESSRISLDSAATLMKVNRSVRVSISAHTDSRGSDAYNKSLSLKRANAARIYLNQKGIPSSRIVVNAYGESRPVNQCTNGIECSEEEHAANRRVEVKLIQ